MTWWVMGNDHAGFHRISDFFRDVIQIPHMLILPMTWLELPIMIKFFIMIIDYPEIIHSGVQGIFHDWVAPVHVGPECSPYKPNSINYHGIPNQEVDVIPTFGIHLLEIEQIGNWLDHRSVIFMVSRNVHNRFETIGVFSQEWCNIRCIFEGVEVPCDYQHSLFVTVDMR